MGLLDDCKEHFGAADLYEVLDIKKTASGAEAKKAYRKLSLKWHPDRHADASAAQLELVTKKFQTLAKVHFVLEDAEKRAFYDAHGVIAGEDTLEGEADWDDYWRCLFPKVTIRDIDEFMATYQGSADEIQDLKTAYLKYDGDMDKLSEAVIGFDEERTRAQLEDLIAKDELPEFEAFTNESDKNRDKRKSKLAREAKMAAKEARRKEANDGDNDLVKAIQSRSKGNFNSLIASLEAKYGGSSKGSKGSNDDSSPGKRKKGAAPANKRRAK